jgi:hypothetical protein
LFTVQCSDFLSPVPLLYLKQRDPALPPAAVRRLRLARLVFYPGSGRDRILLYNLGRQRMDEAIQAHFAGLGNEVQAAALPDGCKSTALWCIGQLPTLYTQFHQTNESRYGTEIVRLVQGVLKELAKSGKACPAAGPLATRLIDRLRLLHEEFGLPGLEFPLPTKSSPRSRKAS